MEERKEEIKQTLEIENEVKRKKSIKEAKRLLSIANVPHGWRGKPNLLFKMAATAGWRIRFDEMILLCYIVHSFIVLYCIVLYCIVLYCIVLYCIV